MSEKKKFVFNWGHGIAVFFSIFVITTISILIISFTKTFDLQTDDYYQEELAFEETITKKKNIIADDISLDLASVDNGIELSFLGVQSASTKGTITVYRPSDKRLDLVFELAVDEQGKQLLKHENLQDGLYSIKVDFTSKSKPYYIEKDFVY